MEYKTSNFGNTYWSGNGVYQQEYKQLYNDYVLYKISAGTDDEQRTFMGEAFRMANKISVEFFDKHNTKQAIESAARWEHYVNGEFFEGFSYKISGKFGYYLDYLKYDFFQHFDNINGMTLVDEVKNILQRIVDTCNSEIHILPEDNPSINEYNDNDAHVYTRLMDEVIYTMSNNIQHDIDFDIYCS